MARIDDNYYSRRRKAEEEAGDRRFNIEEAMKERLEQMKQGSFAPNSETITEKLNSSTFGPGYEEIDAPTQNPGRPRAYKAGYNPLTQTMVIVFRGNRKQHPFAAGGFTESPGAWVQYDGVTLEAWEGLKNSGSTGAYLRSSIDPAYGWHNTDYGSLPRTRPQDFQSGSQRT